ncbi:MAG: WD40 repeat domain-containing protein [Anaerolineae bacterium]|nr:WD40 repeat domain-containing protein [Anaerolineae bacterium]
MLQRIVCWISMLLVMGSLYAADAQENQGREILQIGNGLNVPAVWRHDGEVFARVVDNIEVHFYSPDGEWLNSISLTDEPMNTSISTLWSPDNTRAAFRVMSCHQGEGCSYRFSVWNISADARMAQLIFGVVSDAYDPQINWKPDGQEVAFDGRIYDAITGDVLYDHFYGSAANGDSINDRAKRLGVPIVWSPDGKRYVGLDYAMDEGVTYAIFAEDGTVTPLSESDVSLSILEFVWSGDGNFLTDDYRVWDTRTGAYLSLLYDSDHPVYRNSTDIFGSTQAIWNSDSSLIYTLYQLLPFNQDVTVLYIWDPQTGEAAYAQSFYRRVYNLFWRGGELTARAEDGWELTLNPETGAVLSAVQLDVLISPDSLAWSPDSRQLVVASHGEPNFPLQLWDIAGQNPALVWTVNNDWYAFEANAAQYGTGGVEVRWTPYDEIVTISQNFSTDRMFNSVERWRVEDGQSAGSIAFETVFIMPMVEPSPDLQRSARYFSRMEGSNRIEILEGENVISVLQLSDEDTRSLVSVDWKHNGEQIAVTLDDLNQTQIWDVSTPQPQMVATLQIPENAYELQWSSTERYLVTQGTVYDPATGRVILEAGIPHRYYQPVIVWNPDDTFFTFRAENEIQIWNMTTQQIIEHIPVEDRCCVPRAWSPDGTMLALTAEDGTIRIWDVSAFNE